MTRLRTIGSLCTGYAGLDMAVAARYQAHTIWHSDIDPTATAILAHHWPDVPNLGDFTRVDWSTLERPDIVSAGYPCQPFSAAGRRKGTDDARHLWPHIAEAVRVLRPDRLVLENVAGHRSLGFGDVLGDLAALGYRVRWTSVRASDVGAPHRRERLFIVGIPEELCDPDGGDRAGWRMEHERSGAPGSAARPAADTSGVGRPERIPEPARQLGRPDAAECGRVTAPDTDHGTRDGWTGDEGRRPLGRDDARRDSAGSDGRPAAAPDADVDERARQQLQRAGEPTAAGSRGGRIDATAPDPRGEELARWTRLCTQGPAGLGRRRPRDESRPVNWGKFAAAVERWERVAGPAPHPTQLSPLTGGPQLSPRFVEWMMGLPAGHVTDVTIAVDDGDQLSMFDEIVPPPAEVKRNHQLGALGNGVFPQQAYLGICTADPVT